MDRDGVDGFRRWVERDVWVEIAADSERRRAAPVVFALEAVEDLFGHGASEAEGLERFRAKLGFALWWADDAVQCLEAVLADPPGDLGERVGRIHRVWIDDLPSCDPAVHVEWVRRVAAVLRVMFDAHVADHRADR